MSLRHASATTARRSISAFAVLALALALLTVVAPRPAEAATPCRPYSDVPSSNPHCADINWLKGQRITQPVGGKYLPAQVVTRGSMTAFLYRLVNPGKTPPKCTKKPFPDVPTTNVFCPHITWAKAKKIAAGYTNGTYKPAEPVLRGAMAAYLYRIANPGKTPPKCTKKPFPDVPTTNVFCPNITWLATTGVTAGTRDGTYAIGKPVIRQEMASFLHREFTIPSVLTQAAPPVWSPTGTATTLAGVTFRRSPQWTLATFGGSAVQVTSPPDAHGASCRFAVFAPQAAPATENQRLQLARDYALALGVDTVTNQEDGSDLLKDSFRGSTGNGWDYVGLVLRAGSANASYSILSIMARFGSKVVPFLVMQENTAFGNGWECVEYDGEFGPETARVFFSLALGAAKPNNALSAKVEGDWFSSSGNVGNGYTFGKNGHYIHASVYGGSVWVSPGYWADAYATWVGDGTWSAAGDLLAFFPTGKAGDSRYTRAFEFKGWDGKWQKKLCWINTFEGKPYSYCTRPAG